MTESATIQLLPELFDKVQQLARQQKRMPSIVVTEAVERYIEEQRAYQEAHEKTPTEEQTADLSRLLAEVNDVAAQENRTAGEVMREAVSLYLSAHRIKRKA